MRHAELAATHDAWRAAVALCQRHGRDAGPQAAEGLWFEVLQVSPQAAEGLESEVLQLRGRRPAA